VRVAFASSLSTVWKAIVGLSGIGVLSLFLLKEVTMNFDTDEKYGLQEEKKKKTKTVEDGDAGAVTPPAV